MTKVVLKNSDVLKSARPLVIQPLGTDLDSTSTLLSLGKESLLKPGEPNENPPYNVETSKENEIPEKDSESLLQEAKAQSEELVKQATEDARQLLADAQTQKESLLSKTNEEAEGIRSQIHKESEDAKNLAIQEGMKEGYQKSEEEVKRLVRLLQTVSVQMVDEKKEILDTIESDIVELILMIASKVVKSITTQYKQVVYDNVVAAIGKLKLHNNLVIRVNPDDLFTMEQYKSNLLQEINGIENIQFLEDPTVEQGGCIVKSDFGSIDGRISSQLSEIEEQIRKISPIKPL